MLYGLLVCGCTVAQATLAPQQKQALLDLYQATQGPLWRQSAHWLQGDPCQQHWQGVNCSADGQSVLGLHLPGNRLQGALPASFTALDTLQSLDLRGNLGLSGPLPPLNDLPALTQLNLSFNQFSGPLPKPLRLPRLESLVLSNNLLTGPLPDLSGLPALQNLRLNHNQLSGPLPALSPLGALQALDLSFNQFNGPLPELSQLSQLSSFLVDWNHFQGALPNPSGLRQLHTLSATGNRLSGPLPPLRKLPALAVLTLAHNQLSGSLPRELDLPQLSQLNLAYNLFTGPWPDLSELPQLKRLQLEGNPLSSPPPERPAQLIPAGLCSHRQQGPVQAEATETTETAETAEAMEAEPAWRDQHDPGHCDEPTAPSATPATTTPSASDGRRSAAPGRPAAAMPPGNAHCHPEHRPHQAALARQRSACPQVQAPRRGGGTTGKPLPEPSLLPPWSEWVMALSALLALVTMGLIWRLSWLSQERPLPDTGDMAEGPPSAQDLWLNSHAPPPNENTRRFRPRPSWPPA
jgi:Leucine-rich repeat (LRR) protein